MLHILFFAPGGFETRRYRSRLALRPTDTRIQHGRYILTPYTPGETTVTTDDRYYPRTLSISAATRELAFRDQIRTRDGRCVITGRINRQGHVGIWTGYEAAHIFPLALDTIFQSHGFSNLITYNNPPGIKSPQNGILLRNDIHAHWDQYAIAVNPSDGYKIQSFTPETWDYHGKVLHPVCRQRGHQMAVVDALLHWHYEQAVLCNMRGAGEPTFEFDFPPGTDMMGEIRNGPQPAERMEAELFGRLHGLYQAESSPP
ncbi:HNH endonuclease-domain-containing protein [Aspergillus pseudotamarii]|uniref:HNH endonuclease-domain-containing protein n=1 Tax=Aspergillus pseudotamarii TaxID=132259 RepID=A0A5N6S8K5_ASPPS|nr:HNH endonuclease-domain-containing protein [Aspergillus pseudotamarii]KAE8130998.1 HNH endonuclease-domain-containing protein [Aspergillus pseudotamarii]